MGSRNFAGHSFRAGAATTAAMVGINNAMIQTFGRWHSTAYLLYTRIPGKGVALMVPSLIGYESSLL